jgi:hypothetical protein
VRVQEKFNHGNPINLPAKKVRDNYHPTQRQQQFVAQSKFYTKSWPIMHSNVFIQS